MVESRSKSIDSFRKAFVELINRLLNDTESDILLIPHVTLPRGDVEPLTSLKDCFKDNDRVVLIPSTFTAAQYKGIISRCDMFIGARTHATIAAYSTCVPTLVIGYSVKSKGIAKDLFGTYDGLVIPVEEIDCTEKLIEAYSDFAANKEDYRKRLCDVMPDYIERAKSSIKGLFKI